MSLPGSTDNSRADAMKNIFTNNSVEDVSWLCSLSESELIYLLDAGVLRYSKIVGFDRWTKDMIISLKMLVLQRAKVFGQDQIAQKFDLKMLRALGLIMMEYVKEKVKERPLVAGLGESVAFLDSCNLLKCDVENILESEEILYCIAAKSRKRHANRRQNEAAENQRKRKHREK